jgi:UDP-N-acetylglucosamine--dolichyl-phosphate N-acetylglucosaminephosphotransferase
MHPSDKLGANTSPECMGLPLACWYIGLMMLFIPFPFSHIFHAQKTEDIGREVFPQGEVSKTLSVSKYQLALYLSSLLSLLSATLLGFIDDLFDIRWRHKLPIPLIAAIPTLLVYYSEGGVTSVVLPRIVGSWLNSLGYGDFKGNTPVVKLGKYASRVYLIYRTALLHLPVPPTDLYNQLDKHSRRHQWSRVHPSTHYCAFGGCK